MPKSKVSGPRSLQSVAPSLALPASDGPRHSLASGQSLPPLPPSLHGSLCCVRPNCTLFSRSLVTRVELLMPSVTSSQLNAICQDYLQINSRSQGPGSGFEYVFLGDTVQPAATAAFTQPAPRGSSALSVVRVPSLGVGSWLVRSREGEARHATVTHRRPPSRAELGSRCPQALEQGFSMGQKMTNH